jgi:hypothetical protein
LGASLPFRRMDETRCARWVAPLPCYPVIFALWLIFGAAFGLACGLRAIAKNRTATGWFMLGLIFGPIALVVLFTRERREHPAFL